MPVYFVKKTDNKPDLTCQWRSDIWSQAYTAEIAHFRPENSDHRPVTKVKALYSSNGINGIFSVKDQYVRCTHTEHMSAVYKDSCVEFFVQPKLGKGYFNFEFNCGGAILASYITNPERTPEGFREFAPFTKKDCSEIKIYHSMPTVVEPELQEPTEWIIEFLIPFELLEKHTGSLGEIKGQKWRANFYKCADETSHPHWASWSPVDQLNFHMPDCFGTIVFK
ncbi:MAG: carbohydrate-binding family 9-like protein [Nitrospirae bacterium]|nr:carbohydrate-binding family 9-like protein [Nitrospirota bacterium]